MIQLNAYADQWMTVEDAERLCELHGYPCRDFGGRFTIRHPSNGAWGSVTIVTEGKQREVHKPTVNNFLNNWLKDHPQKED